jgi:hypothetical protein
MYMPRTVDKGLQTGVQDAVNLGWKLAQVVNRTSPERLSLVYGSFRPVRTAWV